MGTVPICPNCRKPMKKYEVTRSDYSGGSLDTTCFSHLATGSGTDVAYDIWECECGYVKLKK